jgi:hypothetical protein
MRTPSPLRHHQSSLSRSQGSPRPRDEPFLDRWLTGKGRLEALAHVALATIEDTVLPRRRGRKSQDLVRHEDLVSTVVANLAYLIVSGHRPQRIAVPLANAKAKLTRYDRPGFGLLSDTLQDLHGAGFLDLKKPTEPGRVSTIAPTRWLRRIVRDAKVTFGDFERVKGEEVIRLSRSEWDYPAGKKLRELIDYSDTATTRRYRADMRRINSYLTNADLAFVADDDPPVDVASRTLIRTFNLPPLAGGTIRFDLGGRLFGGWWENLRKPKRRYIRVDGEPIADLDFKNLFVRLAYRHAGLDPPPSSDDLYAVPGFKKHREGIKKVLSAMLFADKALSRMPRDTKQLFPKGATATTVRAAILALHPALAGTFETGVGYSLMFTESEMLVAILLRLNAVGITALPMHDGIMVPVSKADRAARVMGDAAKKLIGHPLPIVRK